MVTFPSHDEYVVDLTVDAGSLLSRLELLAGQPRSETLSAPEYAARIATLRQELMEHVRVRFDGRRAEAVFESAREADDSGSSAESPLAPQVQLRIHGKIPAGAMSMTWSYDLTYASYALSLKAEDGGEESSEWLEAGQESRALSLHHPGRTLPQIRWKNLADYLPFLLLVVVAVFPFTRRPVGAS